MNNLPESALYLGRIRHRRLRDPERSFSYSEEAGEVSKLADVR